MHAMSVVTADKFATERFVSYALIYICHIHVPYDYKQLGHKKLQPAPNHAALNHMTQDQCALTLEALNARLDQHTEEIAGISRRLRSTTKMWDQRPHFTLPGLMLLGLVIAYASSLYLEIIMMERRVYEIVQERLLLYSKDHTGLRNYAHPFTGADIVASLTSPTYDRASTPGTAWNPEVAISPGLQPGRCWSFSGPTGYLGIMLSDEIVITNVTIEHIALELAPHTDTAPKDGVLWGYVEDPIALQKFQNALAGESIMSAVFPVRQSVLPKHMNSEAFVPLLSFTYDVHAPQFLQTFKVPMNVLNVTVPVRRVVLDIQSNWGNSEVTWLYKVRVHGIAQSQ